MNTLIGIVEDITFRNEENGFTVLRLSSKDIGGFVFCVGTMPLVEPGETIKVIGEYRFHKKFGQQFEVSSYESVKPVTLEGIKSLLGSGLIENIGPVRAQKIVDKFGLDTLDILDKNPQRLLEVDGIGKKYLEKIIEAWNKRANIKELMLFLNECALTVNMAYKIYNVYGDKAKEKISQNPYCLIDDVWGVGFKKADAIAEKLGFEHDSYKRIRAGILYTLSEAASDGHTYTPKEALIQYSKEILQVAEEKILFSLDYLIKEQALICEEERIYLPYLYNAEKTVAQIISQKIKNQNSIVAKYNFNPPFNEWIKKYISKNNWIPDPKQINAVQTALSNVVSIITGGPGTGKTTTLQVIVSFLRENLIKVALAAPTGRAAQRMGSISGIKASTIHRLLEFKPGSNGFRFERNSHNPIDAEFVIIDEVSMIDIVLAKNLLLALKPNTSILFVGDSNQLPSIGPGCFLLDMISSKKIPHIELTTVFRQAEKSTIVRAAHKIITGNVPVLSNNKNENCFFIQENDPEKCCDIIINLVTKRLPSTYGFDPQKDIQVLSPIHNGILGTKNLNILLKQAINPSGSGIKHGGILFSIGDKVMQIRNDYERGVFNGDIGIIKEITKDNELLVDFGEDKIIYSSRHLDDLVHAYCISIHKSQGCEFPAVIIPMVAQHYIMLQRNLIYTAITRAKNLCVITGTKKALWMAIQNNKTQERFSRLCEKIKQISDL
jgi:exodeoxyribonuclease V alpha subunit